MKSKLIEVDRIAVAYALYDSGCVPSWSSNVADQLIAGFGELDHDFEYPLYLIDGEIQPWADVKGWLKTEEEMSHAIDVINDDVERVKDGGYILFEGDVFKAHARTWTTHEVTPTTTFEFISPDGKQQLQTDTGFLAMPLHDWHLFFASDSVVVCDTDDEE